MFKAPDQRPCFAWSPAPHPALCSLHTRPTGLRAEEWPLPITESQLFLRQ